MGISLRDVQSTDAAEIVAMNVRPDTWRSGVGGALMQDALDRFWREGWQAVSLWVVDGNDRAQSFYRRFGFEFDGASTTHELSGARELRMRLPLIAADHTSSITTVRAQPGTSAATDSPPAPDATDHPNVLCDENLRPTSSRHRKSASASLTQTPPLAHTHQMPDIRYLAARPAR